MPSTRRSKRQLDQVENMPVSKRVKVEVKPLTEINNVQRKKEQKVVKKQPVIKGPKKEPTMTSVNVGGASPVKSSRGGASPQKSSKGGTSPVKSVGGPVKAEENTNFDSDSDLTHFVSFEQRRQENLRLNAEFFSQLGINEAKLNYKSVTEKPKKNTPSQRGLKREKPPPPPPRASLRIQNKDPEGVDLPPEYLIERAARNAVYQAPVDEHPRLDPGPHDMKDCVYGTSTPENHEDLFKITGKLAVKDTKSETSLNSVLEKFKKIKLTEKHVAKVVPNRIFSVAIHPSEDQVLVAAGGKWGKLGLWNVGGGEMHETDGVVAYAPFSRPVNCLSFPTAHPMKLFASSYDGTMRCADLNKHTFEEVYVTPEEDDILLQNFDFTSPQTIVVSQSNGCIATVDMRTPGSAAEHIYEVQEKRIKTVSVHPKDKQYVITAASNGLVCLWDLRNLKAKNNKALAELPHGRGVNSAYFSPITGKYILSTSMDDKLTIYDSSTLGSKMPVKHSIRHNNWTGRWLTPFRATWHPRRDDLFVVGSMAHPRQVELFSDSGRVEHRLLSEDWLGSVCCVNEFHPTRNIIVGANASGRLHVFM